MVSIIKQNNQFIFNIIGFHKFFALKSKIIVNQEDILNIYQNREEIKLFKGWRLGTEIPGIITAGEFREKGIINFWDMCKKKNTIIVELKNHRYNKLYVEVENPEAMIALLKS
ncbi:MAG: hypothetical protein H7174_08470 [Flavobacterium sp.]|nr:hypothetical protein [Flavobacterium sp.]